MRATCRFLDAPALPSPGRHGVDPGNNELVVLVKRLQVLADPAAVPRPGCEGTENRVVERDVVVARNDQDRGRKAVQELRVPVWNCQTRARWVRSPETTTRSGSGRVHSSQQWLVQAGFGAAEVQVGQMRDRSHP